MVATASRTRLLIAAVVALGVVVALVLVTQHGSGPSAPTIAVRPSVTGAIGPGKPLHAHVGRWEHTPTSYAYQWQACPTRHGPCSDIRGATGATYTPTMLERPQAYRVRVTARNRDGRASALSARSSFV